MSLQEAQTTNWQAVLLPVKADLSLSFWVPKHVKPDQVFPPLREITYLLSSHHSNSIKKEQAHNPTCMEQDKTYTPAGSLWSPNTVG